MKTHSTFKKGNARTILPSLLVGFLLSFGGLAIAMKFIGRPEDISDLRSDYRLSVRKQVVDEESKRWNNDGLPAWVSKADRTVSVSLQDAFAVVEEKYGKKELKPSTVPLDPTIVLTPDAPKMPSAPSGAQNLKFKGLNGRN